MTYNVTATFGAEQVKVEGTKPIQMYVVNASYSGTDYYYYARYNQDVYGFQMNASGNLTATEQLYTALPLKSDDVKTNLQGEIDTFSISVPNTDRAMESLIQNRRYLRGCDVYQIVGFSKYLPSGATAYHIGTSGDKRAFIKEKFYVDSTTSDENVVKFDCKPKFVIKNIPIPRRTFSRQCSWALLGRYLGSECNPLASINSASYPTCDGTLDNCRERGNEKRFGGWPSIPSRGIAVL